MSDSCNPQQGRCPLGQDQRIIDIERRLGRVEDVVFDNDGLVGRISTVETQLAVLQKEMEKVVGAIGEFRSEVKKDIKTLRDDQSQASAKLLNWVRIVGSIIAIIAALGAFTK